MEAQTKADDTNAENIENIDEIPGIPEIPENPCRCLHLNEPPKPKARPCKHERPKDSTSETNVECYCQIHEPVPVPAVFPLKEYLEEIVAPMLMDGFQAVLQKLPHEPIPFLEKFYAKEMDKCTVKVPPHL